MRQGGYRVLRSALTAMGLVADYSVEDCRTRKGRI
jgi:hypothetical protein